MHNQDILPSNVELRLQFTNFSQRTPYLQSRSILSLTIIAITIITIMSSNWSNGQYNPGDPGINAYVPASFSTPLHANHPGDEYPTPPPAPGATNSFASAPAPPAGVPSGGPPDNPFAPSAPTAPPRRARRQRARRRQVPPPSLRRVAAHHNFNQSGAPGPRDDLNQVRGSQHEGTSRLGRPMGPREHGVVYG